MVQAQIDGKLEWTKDELRYYLRDNFPELYIASRTSVRSISNERLLISLGLPYTGKCSYCQNTVTLIGFRLRKFCSRQCAQSSEETKSLKVENYKDRIGVSHHMQVPGALERAQKTRMTRHPYTDKKGAVHWYQGYENIVLSYLDRSKVVKEFSTECVYLPLIPYEHNEKPHTYRPDISVSLKDGRRLIIEVKSTWTLKGRWFEGVNKAKFKAAKEFCCGSGLEFWVILIEGKEMRWIEDGLKTVAVFRPRAACQTLREAEWITQRPKLG